MELPSVLETMISWLVMVPLILAVAACALVPVLDWSRDDSDRTRSDAAGRMKSASTASCGPDLPR